MAQELTPWWTLLLAVTLVIFGRGWYNKPIRYSVTMGISLIPPLSLMTRLQLMRGWEYAGRGVCKTVGTAIVLGHISVSVANQETRLSTRHQQVTSLLLYCCQSTQNERVGRRPPELAGAVGLLPRLPLLPGAGVAR